MNCHTGRPRSIHAWLRGARLVVCFSIALSMLAGCMVTSSSTATTSPEPAVQPAPQITTLTVWHSWNGARQDALNVLARAYEQTNPMVRIRLESQPAATLLRTFQARVADQSAPQVVILPGRYLGELAARRYVVPLNEQALDVSELLPAAVDAGRVDGQLYGVPLMFDALVLFYDRRAFEAPPATFDQLTAAPTVPVTDTMQWNMGYYLSLERTLPYLPAFGGALVDQNGQLSFADANRATTATWLEWLRALHGDPAVLATPDYSTLDAVVQQERVLSVIDWAYKRPEYEALWPDAMGVGPLPALESGQPQTLVRAEIAVVNAVTSAEQRAAAESFLRFSMEEETQTLLAEQRRGALLPAHTGAAVDPTSEIIREVAVGGQALHPALAAPDVARPLDDMIRSVINGTGAAEAIDAARASIGSGAE